MQFVPLVCPGCGDNLPALEEDVAFSCRSCRKGYELDGDRLTPISLLVIPHPARRAGFYLPFWQFPPGIRIPAFNTRELLSLAHRFSESSVGEEPGAAPILVGATLSSEEARKAADFAGLETESSSRAALLAVPFLDEGNRLLDAVTGRVLYKETIDRADHLVSAARADQA